VEGKYIGSENVVCVMICFCVTDLKIAYCDLDEAENDGVFPSYIVDCLIKVG
jgi:hypothetical protein